VIVELVKETSSKSMKAVVPLVFTLTFERVAPPALYPAPLTSEEVEYAVVLASRVALFVNKAILKV